METPKEWICNIIFIIDASESMKGAKIGTVNSTIEELVPELMDISECNTDVSIYVNVLKIGSSVRWLFKEMCCAETFRWHDIHASGSRNTGMALDELNRKLSSDGFFDGSKKYLKPIVFLLTDGTSEDDYKEPMKVLRNNPYFNRAIRVGVAIGADADRDLLIQFTDCEDRVVTVHTPDMLKKWIYFEEFEEPDLQDSIP